MEEYGQVEQPDQATEPPKSQRTPVRSFRANLRMAALAGIGLLMLVLVVAASNVRLANGIREERAKSVSALAYALREPILQQDPPKLRSLLEGIATAGGYERVSVTDPAGKVVASTDRKFDDTEIKELSTTIQEATLVRAGIHDIYRQTVWLAKDNSIGGVEVVFKAH